MTILHFSTFLLDELWHQESQFTLPYKCKNISELNLEKQPIFEHQAFSDFIPFSVSCRLLFLVISEQFYCYQSIVINAKKIKHAYLMKEDLKPILFLLRSKPLYIQRSLVYILKKHQSQSFELVCCFSYTLCLPRSMSITFFLAEMQNIYSKIVNCKVNSN